MKAANVITEMLHSIGVRHPATQARIGKLMELGFYKPDDVEIRLGYYVGQLGNQ